MIVKKRDGRTEIFNKDKIRKAVLRAAVACDVDDFEYEASQIADDIEDLLEKDTSKSDSIDIEEIQDLVEIDLYSLAENPTIAKAYILYREKHREEREKAHKYAEIVRARAISPDANNQRANANLDENSFSGRMYEAAEGIWKEVALDDFIPKDLLPLIDRGIIYPHDLGRFALGQNNCLTIDLAACLEKGFVTRNMRLRAPNRFASASQLTAVIFQIISQSQFGGIASGHIDRELAPYVEKSRQRIKKKYPQLSDEIREQLLLDEVHQGAEALIHNLASLQSRPGAQLPFSSLNFGADTSPDGRLVSRAILEAMIDGVGPTHSTPPFPILCFQTSKKINRTKGSPNYDLYRLALKCAARRLTPNFVNLDFSGAHTNWNDPDTYLTAMGCRTQMGRNRFNKENPYNRIGRGNLAPHTICPVPLGIKYGICTGKRKYPDLGGFVREFEYLLEKTEQSLLIRANIIFNQKMKAAYELYANPCWRSGIAYDPERKVYDVMKHGSLVIGCLGWAETLKALFGKHHAESEEAANFLEDMMKKMYDFCLEASERNNLNFAVYNTPAENTCFTIMKKMKKQYGSIPGVTDHEYLTNSVHVPVYFDIDVFDKLKLEARYNKYALGGNISYAEFDSTAVKNIDAVEQVVNFAMDQDLPYFAFNFPLDECTVCGHDGEIPYDGCPECGAEDNLINRLRRVTGYITSDYRRAFNLGKQAEVHERVKHTNGVEVSLHENSAGTQ